MTPGEYLICSAMRRLGPAKNLAIAKAIGWSGRELWGWIYRFRKKGWVEPSPGLDSTYRLTEAGGKELNRHRHERKERRKVK